MATIVKWTDAAITGAFDLLCLPLLGLAPIWAMIVISLLTGILMLWIFGKVSNQNAIALIKDKIRGNLIGVRLFQSDIMTVLRLQVRIVRDTLTYMKYSVVPMLIMFVPVMFVIIQLNLRFSVRPLMPGEQVMLKVKVRDAAILTGDLRLEVPEGVKIDTPPVRIASQKEASWRLVAEQPGRHRLVIRAGGEAVEKELIVGGEWGAVSALRTGKNLLEMLLYPGEDPLGASMAVESIEVKYPPLEMPIFGFQLNWLVLFFILSIVFGFAFKGVFGVQI